MYVCMCVAMLCNNCLNLCLLTAKIQKSSMIEGHIKVLLLKFFGKTILFKLDQTCFQLAGCTYRNSCIISLFLCWTYYIKGNILNGEKSNACD